MNLGPRVYPVLRHPPALLDAVVLSGRSLALHHKLAWEIAGEIIRETTDEFQRIANLLGEHPGIGTPTEDQRRWFPLSGFPYSVIYRETETGIRILSCATRTVIPSTDNSAAENRISSIQGARSNFSCTGRAEARRRA